MINGNGIEERPVRSCRGHQKMPACVHQYSELDRPEPIGWDVWDWLSNARVQVHPLEINARLVVRRHCVGVYATRLHRHRKGAQAARNIIKHSVAETLNLAVGGVHHKKSSIGSETNTSKVATVAFRPRAVIRFGQQSNPVRTGRRGWITGGQESAKAPAGDNPVAKTLTVDLEV